MIQKHMLNDMISTSERLATEDKGASAIEYAMIAAAVGAALAATVYSLGTTTSNLYESIAALF